VVTYTPEVTEDDDEGEDEATDGHWDEQSDMMNISNYITCTHTHTHTSIITCPREKRPKVEHTTLASSHRAEWNQSRLCTPQHRWEGVDTQVCVCVWQTEGLLFCCADWWQLYRDSHNKPYRCVRASDPDKLLGTIQDFFPSRNGAQRKKLQKRPRLFFIVSK